MSSTERRSVRASIVAGLVALALALGVVSPALATGGGSGPTYRADIDPTAAAAGTSTTTTIKLTQLVEDGWIHRSELGSARITPPAGFSVTSASATRNATALPVSVDAGSVTVDRLDLDHVGQTASVSIVATVACGSAGNAIWKVVGHQTYSYASPYAVVLPQDPTSSLTSSIAACSLAFVAGHQPSTAGVGQTITATPGDPGGQPIQVQLRDGTGSPVGQAGVGISLGIASGTGTAGASLGGSTGPSGDPGGLGSFAPSIDLTGRGYQLSASAGPGIVGATSSAFNVEGVAMVCSGSCSGTTTMAGTSGNVSADAPGGLLTMTFGLDQLDCNNAPNHFYVATSEVLTFAVTPSLGRKTITLGLDAALVTKPPSKYEVCFSTPNETFVNKYGFTIAPNDPGILPTCRNCSKPSGGPCVISRWKDSAGNVFVKFSVPMADPRGHI